MGLIRFNKNVYEHDPASYLKMLEITPIFDSYEYIGFDKNNQTHDVLVQGWCVPTGDKEITIDFKNAESNTFIAGWKLVE